MLAITKEKIQGEQNTINGFYMARFYILVYIDDIKSGVAQSKVGGWGWIKDTEGDGKISRKQLNGGAGFRSDVTLATKPRLRAVSD